MKYKEVLEGQIKELQTLQEENSKYNMVRLDIKIENAIRIAEQLRLLVETARNTRL